MPNTGAEVDKLFVALAPDRREIFKVAPVPAAGKMLGSAVSSSRLRLAIHAAN